MAAPSPVLPSTRRPLLGVAGFVLLTAALLWWAKWAPSAARLDGLVASRAWSGTSLLADAGIEPGSGPSLTAGLAFTRTYAGAVWKAVLVGLVVAAALQALVPRGWLVRALTGARSSTSAVLGGLASTPSMLCTCCAAPVASALRSSGAPTAAVVAYWLGNPLLNPAVLVFLALVAPWPWLVTRVVVGVLLVVGGSVLVARLSGGPAAATPVPAVADLDRPQPGFLATLLRTAVVLVPEYLLLVLLVGTFSGSLFPLGEDAASWGAMAVVVAVVLGTLLVVPTAGEIPLAQGLALGGLSGAAVGALLITLPAVSLPSTVMVARALTVRVAVGTLLVVAAGGVVAAALLPALSLL